MKRFLLGGAGGVLASVLTLLAQHRASDKVMQPQVLVDNQRVRMVRWVFQPGEASPVHTHSLDHISIVIHGSTVRDVAADGKVKETVQKTGDAVYVPAAGLTHSFANVGQAPYESISIELK